MYSIEAQRLSTNTRNHKEHKYYIMGTKKKISQLSIREFTQTGLGKARGTQGRHRNGRGIKTESGAQ